jgi:1-acyl-sn-glycerol-3-phosphate acyltransferase
LGIGGHGNNPNNGYIFANIWNNNKNVQVTTCRFGPVRSANIVAMPHTSNWGFPIGILIRPIMRSNISFAAKSSLFVFPIGVIMRGLGGYPVTGKIPEYDYVHVA